MNNPTHLLIPIKDIEERISILKKNNREDYESCEFDSFNHKDEGKYCELESLLKTYKQISLDEESIKNLSKKFGNKVYPLEMDNNVESENKSQFELGRITSQIGYSRALKDLLT